MDVYKKDFVIKLQGRLKEEQMILINEIGINKFLEKAKKINISSNFKEMHE